MRSTVHRAWLFDDEDMSAADDVLGSEQLSQVGSEALPFIQDAKVGGKGRFFAGGNMIGNSATTGGSASVLTADNTVAVWFRVRDFSAFQVLTNYQGDDGDVGVSDNYLHRISVGTSGLVAVGWEDSGEADTGMDSGDFIVTKDEWTLMHVRRYSTISGTPGNVDCDIWVNGVLVNTTTDINAPAGGSNSFWQFGGVYTGSSIDFPATADIGSFFVYSAALTPEQIKEDARRAQMLTHYPRADIRVDVEDQSGDLQDMTSFHGLDWLTDANWSDTGDQPNASATITLLREQHNKSIAYLKTDTRANLTDDTDPLSYDPLLDVRRDVIIQTARVPLFTVATDRDLAESFSGRIDSIDWGGKSTAVISARDRGGVLVDALIEAQNTYGSEAGIAVETVMQDVLDDNNDGVFVDSYAPITLDFDTASGQAIKTYQQRREPVLTALRTLAGTNGYECRYRYNNDPLDPGWRLTYYEPQRDRVDADFTLSPDDVLDVQLAAVNAQDVRNVARIQYPTTETALPALPALPAGYSYSADAQGWVGSDGALQRTAAYVSIERTASRSRYGRSMFEITESSTSQIDTITEATNMALAILKDLGEPEFTHTVKLPFFYGSTTEDMVQFLSNAELYTGDQVLAVSNTQNGGNVDGLTTTITCAGKPRVGFKRWLSLDTRPGMGKTPVINPLDSLNDLTLGNLLPYIANYIQRSDYGTGGKFFQIRNENFQWWSYGIENEPDGWSELSGTWGIDMLHDDTTTISGGHSVFFANDAGEIVSDLAPIDGDTNTPYSFAITWQRDTVSDYGPRITVQWLAADRATVVGTQDLQLGSGFPPESSTAANTWFESRVDGIDPPGSGLARFVRLIVGQDFLGTTPTGMYIDTASAYQTARGCRLYNGVTDAWQVPLAGNPWQLLVFSSAGLFGSYDYGNNCTFANGPGNGTYFEARQPGTYRYTVQVGLANSSGANPGIIRLYKNATYDSRNKNNLGTGSVIALGPAVPMQLSADLGLGAIPQTHANISTMSGIVNLERGDRVSVEFWTNDPAGIAALGQSTTGDLTTLFDIKLELTQ